MRDLDYAALAAQFWRDGYVVVEDLFEPALMDEYQGLILDHFGESPEFYHNQEDQRKQYEEDSQNLEFEFFV